MADDNVRIKVSVDGADSAAKGLRGVGDAAGTADSKLGGLVRGGLAGAGAALVGFATATVAAGGALAAGVLNQTAQYEQNIGGIETMFKGSAARMEQYAQDAYKTAGLSANEYMSQATSFSAALLQGLGGDTEAAATIANRAITDMSDNAAKFGSNITDIQNAYQGFAKQNYTMLDNLKLGYGGTQAEMARLINDSGVLGDTFTATATNINEVSYDQIIAAIGVVQDRMGITGTTAAEAAETISGSVDMLKGSFANLLAGLGDADADVAALAGNVISSLQTVIGNVGPVIETLGTHLGTLGPQLGGMIEGLVGDVTGAIPGLLNAGVALVTGLVTGITSALPGLITALIPGLLSMVESVIGLAPQMLSAGLQAIVALARGVAQALPTLIPLMVQGVIGLVQALVGALPSLLDAGIQLMLGLGQGLIAAIPLLLEAMPQIIQGLVNFLVNGVPQLLYAGIELLNGLIQAIPQFIAILIPASLQIVLSLITGLMSMVPALIDAGIQLFLSLIQAMPTIITGIIAAIPEIITGILTALISSLPQLIEAGVLLFMSLITSLPQIIIGVVTAIPQIIQGLTNALVNSHGKMSGSGADLFKSLVNKLGEAIATIVGRVPEIITGITNRIGQGFVEMANVGRDLVRGIWDGISGMANWLFNQIGGFANDVISNVKGFFGIASPSKVMAEIGGFLGQGLIKGLRGTTSQVQTAAEKMNKLLRDALAAGDISDGTANSLTNAVKVGNARIKDAINDRTKVLKRLDEARKALTALEKDRTQTIGSIQGRVIDGVDLTKNRSTDDMKQSLATRVKAVQDFRKKLADLEKQGLDSTTRDQLLDQFLRTGRGGMADTLLAGGAAAVKEIADLQKQLSTEGKKLGTDVANDMYNAGINAAKGLVKGLSNQEKQLNQVAAKLATNLVSTIKRQLGIKSPSTVFEEQVGMMIPAGIGLGVANNARAAIESLSTLNRQMVAEGSKLKTDATWSAQATLSTTMSPVQLAPQQLGPINVQASLDTAQLGTAISDAFSAQAPGEQAPVSLDRASINTLAGAIVDAIRVQSRNGGVTLG
jgi:phage-related protein